MPCEMVSLAFDANLFATKLKERVIHEGLKKQQICRKIKSDAERWQNGGVG